MAKKIKEIDPQTLKQWMDDSQVVLVDVRELCEYQEERISNATLLPISQFKAEKVPSVPSTKKNCVLLQVRPSICLCCSLLERR